MQEYWSGVRILKANAAQALLIAAHHRLTADEEKRIARALVALAIRHNVVSQLDRSRYETTVYATAQQVSSGVSCDVALNELRKLSPSVVRFKVSVRGTASGAATASGGEVEACWYQEDSIAGTGAGRKRIS